MPWTLRLFGCLSYCRYVISAHNSPVYSDSHSSAVLVCCPCSSCCAHRACESISQLAGRGGCFDPSRLAQPVPSECGRDNCGHCLDCTEDPFDAEHTVHHHRQGPEGEPAVGIFTSAPKGENYHILPDVCDCGVALDSSPEPARRRCCTPLGIAWQHEAKSCASFRFPSPPLPALPP
jgi:hypothetical protein